MRKTRIWRALLASVVIGVVEAAGFGRGGRARRRPLRVVWIDDREPDDMLARTGVWFLDPLDDPRPAPGDLRRPADPRGLRLVPLRAARLAGGLRRRSS